jgi:hypothetical protein
MAHIHNNVNTILTPFYGENDGTFNLLKLRRNLFQGSDLLITRATVLTKLI